MFLSFSNCRTYKYDLRDERIYCTLRYKIYVCYAGARARREPMYDLPILPSVTDLSDIVHNHNQSISLESSQTDRELGILPSPTTEKTANGYLLLSGEAKHELTIKRLEYDFSVNFAEILRQYISITSFHRIFPVIAKKDICLIIPVNIDKPL